jgi:peroxiredoxin
MRVKPSELLLCIALAVPIFACAPGNVRVPAAAQNPDVADDGHPFDDDLSSVLGRPPPPLDVDQAWINSPPLTLAALRGRVVLLRWLMSPECPMCTATVPVLKDLDQAYRAQGLLVIGVYHHKDPEPLDTALVKTHVARFGLTIPVAIDRDFKTLNAWWLTGHEYRRFTSVSFLLDRRGLVRHVHLGGKVAQASDEYRTMRDKIVELLKEPAPQAL